MIVQQYRKRPPEVQAVAWDGTVEHASEIIDWVLSLGGTARYHEAESSYTRNYAGEPVEVASLPPRLVVDTEEGSMSAVAGHYVCFDGLALHVASPEQFESAYDPIEPPPPPEIGDDGTRHRGQQE